MNVGEMIKVLRTSAGLSQRELADAADVSPSILSLVESGKREPTLRLLRDVARGLGIPANVLFAAALDAANDLPAAADVLAARDTTRKLMLAAQEFLVNRRFGVFPEEAESSQKRTFRLRTPSLSKKRS